MGSFLGDGVTSASDFPIVARSISSSSPFLLLVLGPDCIVDSFQ